MRKNLFLALLFFTFIATPQYFAQQKDSTDFEDDNDYSWDDNNWWHNWGNNNWFEWEFKGAPFVEVNFGLGKLLQKNMNQDFAKIGDGEIKLGYSSRHDYSDERIIEFKDKYFFISRFGSDMESTTAEANELRSSMWQFGFAKRTGYGYKLGNFYILPYHSEGFTWSRLQMKDYPPSVFPAVYPPLPAQVKAEADREIIDRYEEEFRFGTTAESGITFDIASTFGLNVGYEAGVVFPRHLFWKHAGSVIIEQAGMGLLNHFIDEVADSSPLSVPLVNFILKGAYSYAFYTLKKDKMNWPFDTETPLTYETVKLGVTFTF